MHGVKIRDGMEPGGSGVLEFGLVQVLTALGRAGAKSGWSCTDLDYVSKDDPDVPVLQRAMTPGQTVSGTELIDGLGPSLQIVEGRFTGLDEEGEAWVVVRAVHGAWWEVWSDNKWVHDAIRAHFRVVEDLPQDDATP